MQSMGWIDLSACLDLTCWLLACMAVGVGCRVVAAMGVVHEPPITTYVLAVVVAVFCLFRPAQSDLILFCLRLFVMRCRARHNRFSAVTTYMSYALLMLFGRFREALDWLISFWRPPARRAPAGYAPLVADWEDFYTRRMYHRIVDCWNRPIASCPGAWFDVIERTPLQYGKPLEWTGRTSRALNLGSYNYLGFGDPDSPTKGVVLEAVEKFSVATTSTRNALGTTTIHRELEKTVARFVRKDDAMIFGMGFGTNSCGIPALIGKVYKPTSTASAASTASTAPCDLRF